MSRTRRRRRSDHYKTGPGHSFTESRGIMRRRRHRVGTMSQKKKAALPAAPFRVNSPVLPRD